MLMPARLVATFTEAHTFRVTASASGRDSINILSPLVNPLCTSAENPPRKFTPVSSAARCRAWAKAT